MNYWKSSESNPVKAILLIAVIALAGYFIYANAHERALRNTAQVTPADQQKKKGGEGERGSRCLDGVAAGTLVPALGPAFPVTTVRTSTQAGGRNQVRGIFTLRNPGECPMKLTDVSFSIDTDLAGVWPPMQNIRLFVATTPFGASLPFPAADPSCGAGNPPCILSFSNPSGQVINPGATVQLRVVSDALNVPGGHYFAVRLDSLKAIDMLTSAIFSWSGPAIRAGIITVVS